MVGASISSPRDPQHHSLAGPPGPREPVYISMSTGRILPVLCSLTHSSLSLAGSTFRSSWSTGSTVCKGWRREDKVGGGSRAGDAASKPRCLHLCACQSSLSGGLWGPRPTGQTDMEDCESGEPGPLVPILFLTRHPLLPSRPQGWVRGQGGPNVSRSVTTSTFVPTFTTTEHNK